MKTSETMTNDRIHKIRIALGLTRAQLAEKLGTSYQAIWRYERAGAQIPQTIEVAMRTVQREIGEERRG